VTQRKARGAAQAHNIFAYFDNDAKVRAPFDAQRLAERLGEGALKRGVPKR